MSLYLECSKCGEKLDANKTAQLCPKCAAPLLVRYDLKKIDFSPKKLANRPYNLWRYKELLPIKDDRNIVSLGEVITPLIKLDRTAKTLGFNDLYLKDEGMNPSGTFKSRGAAMGISKAKELGVKSFIMPTNGNAGASWALYGARAGIKAHIVMPKDAPEITKKECAVAGADLYLVDGLISDAGKIVAKAVKQYGIFDASTLKEPYRIEGKKTMALEILEQFDWRIPDVILYPTGGGVGLIGIYKALLELRELNIIDRLPRLVAVQAENCAPIVKAFEEKAAESVMWQNAKTIAFGITVPKALGDFLVLEALYQTNGTAKAVSDADILTYQSLLARNDGLFICPEGAAVLAAADQLLKQGWIAANDRVVLLNTGSGLKYPETVNINTPLLNKEDEIIL
ncbi:threonine synthase [Campylobacterota bacterium]|nr:threonine synthase [Campylobacterota bacterium]